METGYIGGNYEDYFIGGESIGWSINEDCHYGYYAIPIELLRTATEYRSIILNGAQMWSSVANIYEATSSGVDIGVADLGENGIAGISVVLDSDVDPNTGHVTIWVVGINSYYGVNATTVAHELGHVIGLTDLYSNYNTDKIMYYDAADSTAITPTYYELRGAEVILGLHGAHNFEDYRYWGEDTNGNHYHVQYCSYCNGNKATKARCFFSPTDPMRSCITCGYSTYLAP